jgi:uroporphyrin-III C-methyltransferase/precorrin-2 dehydrogenase/sirohydrochlorin ferrochelatase
LISSWAIERAKAGRFVVRLKGGDPFVFGRGHEEVVACAEAGVPVLVVPGLSSAVSVPGLAGVPVTHRGLAQEFTVVSGHVVPGDPKSQVDWDAVARLRGTLVLLMAVERLAEIGAALLAGGKDPRIPVVVVQDGSRPGERTLRTRLETMAADVAGAGIAPPAIVVIGEVAGL